MCYLSGNDLKSFSLTCSTFSSLLRLNLNAVFLKQFPRHARGKPRCQIAPVAPISRAIPIFPYLDSADRNDDTKICLASLWSAQSARIDHFDGLYKGSYGPHGDELVHIKSDGFFLSGLKITGDANVPRGQWTFQCRLVASMAYGLGKIQLADTGFVNQRTGNVQINVVSEEQLSLLWFFPFFEEEEQEEQEEQEGHGIGLQDEDLRNFLAIYSRGFRVIRTTFTKYKVASLGTVERIIRGMEKDELGNVDRNELNRILQHLP